MIEIECHDSWWIILAQDELWSERAAIYGD
jgi:hypothetical protein